MRAGPQISDKKLRQIHPIVMEMLSAVKLNDNSVL